MSTARVNHAAQKTTVRRVATEKRRRDILDAALACFLKNGVAGTTIEHIRAASKASHGSIYHLFRSKDEIALTLFVEGMQLYHKKIVRAVENETTARGIICAIVTAHLKDALDDPALSIYLTRMGMADDLGQLSQQFRLLNDEFAQEIWSQLKQFVDRGEMVRLPKELYFSLIIGPTAHLARSWLCGRVDFDPLSVIEHLADAAWKSLQAD